MDRLERVARNEALFREVNDRIYEMVDRLDLSAVAEIEIVCECARPSCFERVVVTRRAYEQVRSELGRFIVRRAHEDPEFEAIVLEADAYLVVEKILAGES